MSSGLISAKRNDLTQKIRDNFAATLTVGENLLKKSAEHWPPPVAHPSITLRVAIF
jgi:hypothetical protein